MGQAVETRVDRANDLRGNGGIVLDDRGNLPQRDICARGEFEHAHSHDGKRRKVW